jgi:hypothetical protein
VQYLRIEIVPNRIIRDGILTSERVDLLGWAEEVFYRRLQSVVDDHGRFHANPKLIRAACFPLRVDKVSDADIGKWTASCSKAGLVSVYPALDGKRYLQIINFGQRIQAKSKFPDPLKSVSEGDPPSSTVENRLVGDGVEDGGDSASRPKAGALPAEPIFIELPLNDGSQYPVTEGQVREFSGLYPAVDVKQSLRGMRAWCITNPARCKTRHGVLRFVNSWLSKDQDNPKGGGSQSSGANSSPAATRPLS